MTSVNGRKFRSKRTKRTKRTRKSVRGRVAALQAETVIVEMKKVASRLNLPNVNILYDDNSDTFIVTARSGKVAEIGVKEALVDVIEGKKVRLQAGHGSFRESIILRLTMVLVGISIS